MGKRKYSKGFEDDFNWYLKVRKVFNFDGQLYNTDIVYDKTGVDGKKAFFLLDSQGKMVPTKHPNMLRALILVKGGVNLHIKMYAEDRAKGYLPKISFEEEICKPLNVPEWFVKAVENQRIKYLN